jgi:hypothetical protein
MVFGSLPPVLHGVTSQKIELSIATYVRTTDSQHLIPIVISSKWKRCAGHIVAVDVKNAYKSLVGSAESRRLIERPRHGWEDTIKMNLNIAGCQSVDWIHLHEDRVHWWILVIAA